MKQNSGIGLLEREKEVLRLIDVLRYNNLNFIVIGGYAVSTYKKRFSVDLDIVIKESDLQKFEKLLEKEGFTISYEKEIALLYGENFKRFGKKMNNLPVDADLLINGLVSRTTNASWSFDFIEKNSEKGKLDNLELLIPCRELLLAMKIHSGRLSDTRDIVALMPCNEDRLKKFLLRGDINTLRDIIKRQLLFLEKPQFDDSFKGIFGIQAYDKEQIETAKRLFKELLKKAK
jgi:hypothetical protein